ncbi:hypothetical protein ABKN59_009645 [Abortiporus biennis]
MMMAKGQETLSGQISSPLEHQTIGRLPQEVNNYIIDHLWRHRHTLRACSLVCRAWKGRSQSHIHRSVTFMCARFDIKPELYSSPDVARHVRIVKAIMLPLPPANDPRLSFSEDSLEFFDRRQRHARDLWNILSRLTNLQTLELLPFKWMSWSVESMDICAKVFNHVTSLTIDGLFEDVEGFLSFLSLFPHLAKLELAGVKWTGRTLPTEQLSPRIQLELDSIPGANLRSLTFSGHALYNFSVLHDLTTKWFNELPKVGVKDMALKWIPWQSIDGLQVVLEALGPAVGHLEFRARYDDSPGDFNALQSFGIERSTNLRSVTLLSFSGTNYSSELDTHGEHWVHRLLTQTTTSPEFTSMEVQCDSSEWLITKPNFRLFDNALAQASLRDRLSDVSLNACSTVRLTGSVRQLTVTDILKLSHPTSIIVTMAPMKPSEIVTNSEEDVKPAERCKEFWFEDGNIILLAEETSFRVHKTFLSRHSTVFNDILNIPQTQDSLCTQVDGCPTIYLSDSKEDIHCMLSVLYDGGNKYFGCDVALPFSTVSSMLTIGMKYQIDKISQEAIRRLNFCFPTHLSNFIEQKVFLDGPSRSSDTPMVPIEMENKDAIQVIHLANMFDITSVLPTAYYACAQLSIDELVMAVEDQLWSLDMLRMCLNGRETLRKKDMSQLSTLFSREMSLNCENDCSEGMAELLQELQESGNLGGTNALSPSSAWFESWAQDHNICKNCIQHCMSDYERLREETWSELGNLFGI